jgi:hypothetical protein
MVKGGGNVEEEPVVVKKAGSPTDISVSGVGRRVEEGTATKSDVYDPSKESRWTRIGSDPRYTNVGGRAGFLHHDGFLLDIAAAFDGFQFVC